MIHQAQNLVDCFLSGDFSNYAGAGLSGFSGTENELFINKELIIYKSKNDIIIQHGDFAHYSCLVLLNLFPGVATYHNQGKCFINGIEWDGKKTKLSFVKTALHFSLQSPTK